MPGLDAYAALAPFQIEELVDAANSILRDRPRLRVSKRTVRYYVSQGVLPAPRGAPKFARYGMEHLAKLVGARAMQDEGQSLEEVGEALRQAFRGGEASGVARIQRLLAAAPESQGYVAEQIDAYVGETPQGPLMEAPTRRLMRSSDRSDAATPVETLRFSLCDGAVLEVQKGRPVEDVLRESQRAIERLLYEMSHGF